MSTLPPPPPPPPPTGPYGQYAPPAPYPAYPAPYFAPPIGPAPGLAYAGFWIRFAAYLIDSLITLVPLLIVFSVLLAAALAAAQCSVIVNGGDNFGSGSRFGSATCANAGAFGVLFIPFLLFLVVPALYFIVMWAWKGATVGQRMLGLWVVDANNGAKISGGRSILRYIGYIVSGYIFCLGFMWAGWDSRKQGWHDKIASTFVVRRV